MVINNPIKFNYLLNGICFKSNLKGLSSLNILIDYLYKKPLVEFFT